MWLVAFFIYQMSEAKPNIQADGGGNAIKDFQLTLDGIKDKSSKEFGIAVSELISGTVYSGLGGYYFDRNARFAKNRAFANGKIDVRAMFADRFDYNGKENYINIAWDAVQIVNRIISGLVGRWMGRNEKNLRFPSLFGLLNCSCRFFYKKFKC